MGTINGILTGVLLVLFVGIWVWAWSGERQKTFDHAARLPLEDDALQKEEKTDD